MKRLNGLGESSLRHEKKWQRLGSPSACCRTCAISDIRCLRIEANSDSIICETCSKKRLPLGATTKGRRLATMAAAGYPEPSCAICQECALETLELHHIAGQVNSSIVVPLCGNCHAIQSDLQIDLPKVVLHREPESGTLRLQAAFEFGVALFLISLAVSARSAAESMSLAAMAATLVAWGIWNLAADKQLTTLLGANYGANVPASIPT